MTVLTPDRVEVRTEEELIARFQAHRDHGYAQFVLIGDKGAYLSAIGEGFGPYTIEWFPAQATGTHLRAAEEFKSAEVMAALLDFFRGGAAWREIATWHEVEDERPPLPARLMEGLHEMLGGHRRRESGDDEDFGVRTA
jgi:hypothetical protein